MTREKAKKHRNKVSKPDYGASDVCMNKVCKLTSVSRIEQKA